MSNTYNQAGVRPTIDFEQVCYRPKPIDCTSVSVENQGAETAIPDFNTSTLVANPNNVSISTIANSHNGNAGGTNFMRFNVNQRDPTGVVIDYSFTTPQNNPAAIYLWSGGGGNLSDGDGVRDALATLYNAAGTVLWTGTLNGGNTGSAVRTDVPTGLTGVSRMRIENVRGYNTGAPNIHVRLIRLVGEYNVLYAYDCAELFADIRGEVGTVTLTGSTISQTTTPHTITFSQGSGQRFKGTIVTDQPNRFSALTFDENNPTIEFTGTGVANFAVQVLLPDAPGNEIKSGTIEFNRDTGTRTLVDSITGTPILDQDIVPCEDNTVTTADANECCSFQYIELCDDNGIFLRRFDNEGGFLDYLTNGVTQYSPVGDIKICGVNGELTIETYRIAGTATGTSTRSIAPGDVPNVGNTVTIPAGYQSIAWHWLRQTQQDPGTGATARLIVNGFDYHPGSGAQYQTVGKQVSVENGNTALNAYQFTASGQAFVEITVIR